jgi:hypothetical protein
MPASRAPVLVLSTLPLLLTTACASGPPGWTRSYTFSDVLRRAEADDGIVLLQVVGDHCRPCREMDLVLDEEAVRVELVGFIRLRYHAGKTGGEDLARRFGLSGYPHLLAIDGRGRVVGHTGALAPEPMIRWLRRMRALRRSMVIDAWSSGHI